MTQMFSHVIFGFLETCHDNTVIRKVIRLVMITKGFAAINESKVISVMGLRGSADMV